MRGSVLSYTHDVKRLRHCFVSPHTRIASFVIASVQVYQERERVNGQMQVAWWGEAMHIPAVHQQCRRPHVLYLPVS
jgi:hypothetical protein